MGAVDVSHETIFCRNKLDRLLANGLEALVAAHHREVANDQGDIKLKTNWPRYRDQEKTGDFIGFGAWKGSELIGYSGFFLSRSLHYSDHSFALNDVIYLKPRYRGAIGLRMIVEAENELALLSVSKIFYHCKANAVLGDEGMDSLTAVEALIETEKTLGRQLPDDAAHARTLADVLAALGYTHQENIMGKRLTGEASWAVL